MPETSDEACARHPTDETPLHGEIARLAAERGFASLLSPEILHDFVRLTGRAI
jgi:hypothetical protein